MAAAATSAAPILASLKRAALFAGLPAESLERVAASADVIRAEAGSVLFRQGEISDSAYIVRAGALSVLRSDGGPPERVADIYGDETVGEMGLLTGDARTATVVCQRDSELVRIPRAAFNALLAREPKIAREVAILLARRLALARGTARAPGRPKVFALIAHPEAAARAEEFARQVLGALKQQGTAALAAARVTLGEFQALETAHDFVLLADTGGDAGWSQFCRRQADTILLAADAAAEPAAFPALDIAPDAAAKREILLFGDTPRGNAARWLELNDAALLQHLNGDAALARFGRLAARRAVSVVLGGGGARGFAHIGVIRALREAGIAIDIFGGTSMGAVIAAGFAMGWPREMIEARMRRAFVEQKLLKDPAIPVVSLFKGRGVHAAIDGGFGGFDIEDMPHPFYCVSTDLTRGRAALHRRGNLALWLKATTAIPGVLPPVIAGGAVHVDGGVVDSVPISGARELGRGPVIAIDVAGENTGLKPPEGPVPLWQALTGARLPGQPGIADVLWRVGTIGTHDRANRAEWERVIALRPPVSVIGLLEWRGFDRAVAAGYEYARKHIGENADVFGPLKG